MQHLLKMTLPSIAITVTIVWSMSVSVTLMLPAEAVGRNEMPFVRDTSVVSSNIYEIGVPVRPWEGDILWVCSDAVRCLTLIGLPGIETCRDELTV